jgi:drug/metabolite transporter (DMT)-like permease
VLRLNTGVVFALLAAALFGASTPFAKLLVGSASAPMLAALLYLGSGAGLIGARLLGLPSGSEHGTLSRVDIRWLAGAILAGGIAAPVCLMAGLATTPASTAALLLNLEGLFTAALAWVVFRENVDARVALGIALILAGGATLAGSVGGGAGLPAGAALIAAACAGWALDNNLTQKVSASDPILIAGSKGLVAGTVNLIVALAMGHPVPSAAEAGAAATVGFLGYGVSLVLFVLALRHLGTARTGAYFSVGPFIGAATALVLLREPIGGGFAAGAALMAAGVWLHLTERHEHEHTHEVLAHTHRHAHDAHHRHEHSPGDPAGEPHTHWHVHEPLTHRHPHYPDIHHRHRH